MYNQPVSDEQRAASYSNGKKGGQDLKTQNDLSNHSWYKRLHYTRAYLTLMEQNNFLFVRARDRLYQIGIVVQGTR